MNYIFHHNDPDGYFSAALFLTRFNAGDITFIEMCHPELPTHTSISKKDNVYIVDYTPGSIDNLKHLCTQADSVVLIDHHVSTYNKFKDVKLDNFYYHYNENKFSACEQVYNYLALFMQEQYAKIYELIKLVSDYDSWKHKYKESTDTFYGTITIKDPYEAYEYLSKDLSDIIEQGKIIYNYILYNATKLRGISGKISRADKDYTILIKNTHLKGAFLFTEKEKEDYDFVCIINFKDNIIIID
jgi:oligoribonuclease NrnB/cAMP/cGMP phosphodiesterase (DHH superfamily)